MKEMEYIGEHYIRWSDFKDAISQLLKEDHDRQKVITECLRNYLDAIPDELTWKNDFREVVDIMDKMTNYYERRMSKVNAL